MVKISIFIDTGFAGCRHEDVIEIDDEEWNEMDESERQDMMNEYCHDAIFNRVDTWWEVIK